MHRAHDWRQMSSFVHGAFYVWVRCFAKIQINSDNKEKNRKIWKGNNSILRRSHFKGKSASSQKSSQRYYNNTLMIQCLSIYSVVVVCCRI